MSPRGQKRLRSKSPEKSPKKTPKVVIEEIDEEEEYLHCLRFGKILTGLPPDDYHETMNSISEFQIGVGNAKCCKFYRDIRQNTEYTPEIYECVYTFLGFHDELVSDEGPEMGEKFLKKVMMLTRMIINTTKCPANPFPVKKESVFKTAISLVIFCNQHRMSCPINFDDMDKIFQNLKEKYSDTN